jgi:AraC-like DNA-binding protein
LKVKRRNGFLKRFEQRYGKGSVTTFKTMIESREGSLSDVGRHFGFSREYARQVFHKIYGHPYTSLYRQKVVFNRLEREAAARRASRQQSILSAICRRLEFRGLNPGIRKRGRVRRILVNGCVVDLKMTSSPTMINDRERFRISLHDCPQREEIDFFVCLLRGKKGNTYYIIPGQLMPRSGVTLSPEGIRGRSKYVPFREAWHLLKTHDLDAARAA